MSLPRSIDDLHRLRAARWIRESTRGQFDNFGPDAQRDQQDRAIERYGLIDTQITWTVAHSGRTVANTDQFRDMLARAGREYDVLLVGYVSRFTRNLKDTLVAIEDRLQPAGAVVLFCDERVLSSDPDQWESWTREAHEAEAYRRRLGRRIREGYEAKFRRLSDQGGNAPFGFRRSGPARTLEIDPNTIGRVVAIFERYSEGVFSYEDVGTQSGINTEMVRAMLDNPIYNGWARRYRRSSREQRSPTPWRINPPVSDELWQRVQDVRSRRHHGRPIYKRGSDPRRLAVLPLRSSDPGKRHQWHSAASPAAPSGRVLRMGHLPNDRRRGSR